MIPRYKERGSRANLFMLFVACLDRTPTEGTTEIKKALRTQEPTCASIVSSIPLPVLICFGRHFHHVLKLAIEIRKIRKA